MNEEPNRAWKDQYMLRFPDGMRDQIKRLADSNKRSMNAEIIALLEKGLRDADYLRMIQGLEPFGDLTDDERDRVLLGREDTDRRLAARAKALADHGVDNILQDVADRLERIEKKLDAKD